MTYLYKIDQNIHEYAANQASKPLKKESAQPRYRPAYTNNRLSSVPGIVFKSTVNVLLLLSKSLYYSVYSNIIGPHNLCRIPFKLKIVTVNRKVI